MRCRYTIFQTLFDNYNALYAQSAPNQQMAGSDAVENMVKNSDSWKTGAKAASDNEEYAVKEVKNSEKSANTLNRKSKADIEEVVKSSQQLKKTGKKSAKISESSSAVKSAKKSSKSGNKVEKTAKKT